MSAIDTNVLARYIVADDDAAQSAAARFLIDEVCSAEMPALVLSIVLAEFVWVLRSSYRFTKKEIVSALEAIALNPNIAFDSKTEFLAALDAFRNRSIDFADCLIAARATTLNAGDLFTFDEKAAGKPPFKKLPAPGA
jgi:predicted nucleic-acid-binding protein